MALEVVGVDHIRIEVGQRRDPVAPALAEDLAIADRVVVEQGRLLLGHRACFRSRWVRDKASAAAAGETMANYDAIVIGGGVVGMATAYHLVSAGVRTLLIDRDDRGRASDAGAGIISAGAALDDPDPVERFAARAVLHYAELIEALAAEGAGETGYGVLGALTVALDDDERAPFEELRRRRSDHAEVSAGQAQAMFPPLAPVRRALHDRRQCPGRWPPAGRSAAARGRCARGLERVPRASRA